MFEGTGLLPVAVPRFSHICLYTLQFLEDARSFPRNNLDRNREQAPRASVAAHASPADPRHPSSVDFAVCSGAALRGRQLRHFETINKKSHKIRFAFARHAHRQLVPFALTGPLAKYYVARTNAHLVRFTLRDLE